MNSKYEWNLKEIFKNKEEFEQTKTSLKSDLSQIKTYEGKLCESSKNLYETYKIYENALQKFEKLYAYGMLFYHLDMSNQEGIKLYKEVEDLGTEFSTATSFMTPEITYADKEKIEKFLQENKELQKYKRSITDILKEKEHILSRKEENLLANYSEIFSAPENVFDILTNAEFKFGILIDSDGKEVEMTDSNYTVYLKDSDENVRKQAFDLMYKKYSDFVNTITELYLANVKSTTISANLRKYKSSLEKAVISDDASIKVYEALIETINKNMAVNHKFIELKKKLLILTILMVVLLQIILPLKSLAALVTGEKFSVEVVKVVKNSAVQRERIVSRCLQSTGHSGYNHSTNLRSLAQSAGFLGYVGYNWSQYTTVPSTYTSGLAPNNNYASVHYNIKEKDKEFLFSDTGDGLVYNFDLIDNKVIPYNKECVQSAVAFDDLQGCIESSMPKGTITQNRHPSGIIYWEIDYKNPAVDNVFFWVNNRGEPFKAYINIRLVYNFSLFIKMKRLNQDISQEELARLS